MSLHLSSAPREISGPLAKPSTLRYQDWVVIRHPGLNLKLFSIPCFPEPTGAHLGLILDICLIIANNQPGSLSMSPNQTNLDATIPSNNRDLILLPGSYYYHLSDETEYPVVLEFDAWTPPKILPEDWRVVTFQDPAGRPPKDRNEAFTQETRSVVSALIKYDDGVCAMTGSCSRLGTCHLIPKANGPWFMAHRVSESFPEPNPSIDHPVNIITLRADLTRPGIDQGHFVFIPIQGRLTVYFTMTGLPDLAYEFHCRRIYLPTRISRHSLYYRFAWSVFKIIAPKYTALEPISIPIPNEVRVYQALVRKGKGRGGDPASLETTESGDIELDNDTSTCSSSQSTTESEKPLDLSPYYDSRDINKLADQDARIREEVGPQLDESNLHLLSLSDQADEWYPGFSNALRLKQNYVEANPQVRAVNQATTTIGRVDDGYESDSWGWTEEEKRVVEE